MQSMLLVFSLVFSCLLLGLSATTSAQVVFRDSTQTAVKPAAQKLQLSLGVGFGYANPAELNRYIEEEISSVWAVSGSTDLSLYVVADAALYIPLSNRWKVGPMLEGAIASRSFQDVSSNMETSVYSLSRLSPGVALQYRMPLPNTYWYIIPAFQYHSLTYNSLVGKSLKDTTYGLRLEIGSAIQKWSFDLHYKGIITLMNPGNTRQSQPELNFSGIALGIGISFP